MNRNSILLAVAGIVISGLTACGGGKVSQPSAPSQPPPSVTFLQTFQDSSGSLSTFSKGPVDTSGPLFSKLGTNDRTCTSCHDSSDGWSITPTHLQQKFDATQGTDPVFRPVDGANCPSADVSTATARSSAYSLLLSKGLIRISLPIPANAEFSIISVTDPYQCPETTTSQPALYRRPLPSTNLRFLNGIMWDGARA
jgi:cytochrome c peroxidase